MLSNLLTLLKRIPALVPATVGMMLRAAVTGVVSKQTSDFMARLVMDEPSDRLALPNVFGKHLGNPREGSWRIARPWGGGGAAVKSVCSSARFNNSISVSAPAPRNPIVVFQSDALMIH